MWFRNVLRPYLGTNITKMMVQVQRRLTNSLCHVTMISTSMLYVVYRSHPSCFGLSLSVCLGCAATYISLLCSVQTRDQFRLAPLSSIVPHLSLPLCLLHLFSSHFLFVFPPLCSLVVRFGCIILSSLLNYSLHLL